MSKKSSSLRSLVVIFVGLLSLIQSMVGQTTAPQISTPADLGSVATNSAIEPIVLQAAGGTQPYTWSLVTGTSAGVLPPGLSLGADGRITGTPATAQTAKAFTVRVTDAANATVQKAFTIAVGTDSPRISSAAMGGARVGEAYSHTFQVLQGKKPYTWSTNSTLPLGLTLNPTTGVISGTPDSSTVNATANFRDYPIAMRLAASGNATHTANFTLTVAKPMEWVTPPNLPVQFAGPNCTVGILVSGGKAPYSFSVQPGSTLPPGLSLGNSTGILSGKPSAVGNFTFTINATDSVGSRISRAFAIQFIPYTLTISGPASASGTQYTSATPLQFSAIGGAEPYRYSATNLPSGLTLNATSGLITGNFNGTAGTTNFTVTVTDNKAMTANATCAYTITPGPALKWTIDPALPAGKVPGFYSANLSAATGGWAPYTYSVNASTLPAGLTFNPATRRLSGNATAGGNFSVVLTVRDSATPPNVVNATLANSAVQSIPLYIEPYGMSINGTSNLSVNQYSALTATQFTVNGGAAPYTWTTASALPAALTLNATGTNRTVATLAGNATAAPGNYTIGVRVTDKIGQSVTSNVTLTIAALPITWGTQALLPAGKVASAYTTNLTVSGGRPGYTYALKNGSVLPAGLTLNATTGVISGTPTRESVGDALAGKVILNVSKTGNDTTGNGSSAAPFATIQKAIDSASNGNVVVVGPGTYSGAGNTNLNLRGKQIVVKSSAGADQTILDLGRQKGISADSTETLDTVIDGFTFKNGYVQSGADWGGEAIVCTRNQASLKIKNCVFTLNETKATYVTTSMQIVANRSSSASIPQVENCLFYENTIGGGGWTPYSGGGASVISGVDISNSTIANNTLYSSVSSWGGFVGGIRIAVTGDKIKNSIVWGNSASFYPSTFAAKYQAGAQSDSSTSVAYSISQNGTINNGSATVLNADPKFVNATSGDFRLAAGSPAIDAGDPASAKDSDGSRADMGYRKTAEPSNGFTFTIIASDSASPVKNTAEREFTLPIASYGMAVGGPAATSAAQYSALTPTQFTVSGGVAPYRWSATALPATLSINATTGLVSGNLTAAPGNYTANITVTDNRSQTATKNYTVTVSALPMAWSTNATLPAGKVADAYSTNLTVTSGRPPYSFALSNSTLPAGLALNTATGLLSGTPTLAGNYSFTINASDSAVPKNTISRNFTLTIAPYGMAISGPVSISGQQYNSISSTQFLVSGGAGNYTWSTVPSPAVPAALSINATTGLLSGNLIAAPGNYTLGIKVADKIGQSVTSNLTVTVLQGTPLSWVTAANLPNAKVATPYSTTLQSTGGLRNYSYTLKTGSALPPGLKLATYTIQLLIYPPVPGTPNTVLEGTPTSAGTYKFTLVARDSLGNTVDREFTLVVDPYGMSIAENAVISGKRFTSITPVQLAVAGGIANYTWSTSPSPIVPASLTLNSSTGLLSGNLTAAPGNYTLVASVRDGRNQTATRNLTVSILQVDPINWTTNATLTPGKVADNYSANLTVRDGTPPYTFAIKSGSTLPGNLTLNATGALRGIPATAGNFTFTLIARDSGNATTERAFTLAVAPYGMAITNEPPITGQMNQAFSYPFTVSGGIAAYTWNATGALNGLSMNATSGVLSGTPTASGNFVTSVRVTDGKAQAVSRNYTISIVATAPLSISTPPNLGTIDINKGYTTTLQAVGGRPPYTWTINGTKPASVNLAANGTLTANSSTALTANFTVRVQDSSTPAANATQVMTLTYRNPNQLAIATSSLPQGRVNSEYSHQLAATGGATPYLWTISAGTLPAGMVFSPTGWLTGTPTVTANTTLTFEVTDSTTVKSSRQLQLVIGSASGNATASGKLFTDVTSSVNLPEHYIIALEDFDNDGREDLLATNAAGSVVLLRNAGAFDFRDITANAGLTDVQPALVADFNNDGVSDILSVNLQRSEATLFLNNGQGVFTQQPLTSLLTGDLANYRDISFADVDGDGDLDLLFNINAASGGAVVAVFNQANVSQKSAPLFSGKSYLVKTTWKNAKFSVTDANGDGKPDLVVLQTNGAWPTDTHRSNPASLYLNTGNATADYANPTGAKTLAGFTIKPNSGINGGNEMSAFTSFDIDNDGDLDLLNGSSDWPSASVPRIFINDGTGTYTQKDSPILHGSYYHHGATIFDADLDGDQDAVWTSLHVFKDVYPRMWENGATYLKATANGTVDPAKAFYDATADWGVDAKISGSGNMGSAGYTADLDGDGDLDFVTNLWSNTTTFKIYRNDSNLRQANWLKVELIGAVSPAQGTGARVEVELKDANAKKPAQVTGASRYEMVAGSFTWTQAKADAESRGGHLATVGSQEEWDSIKTIIAASKVWLGGTDSAQEGVWRWVDGTPWTFSNWASNQPDNAQGGNTSMPQNYLGKVAGDSPFLRWQDYNNDEDLAPYLLERENPTATTKLAQYLGSDIGSATNSSLTFGLADKTQAAKVTVYWPSGLKSVLENVDGNRTIQIREADELPLPRPTDEGDVIAWGANPNGETTVPTNLGKAVQIAAGDSSSAALRTDGTVSVWGTNWAAQRNVPASLGNVVQIAAGNNHYLALTANGSVVAWGWNTTNQTVVPTTIKRAKFIAAGFNSSYAITGDGRIVAWGANDVGQLNVPAGLTGVTALSAGRGHVLALKSNGTVVAWGRNDLGQATVPAGLTNVIQIAAGDYHSLALKSDGTVVAWGANWISQSTIPAGLGNVVQISAKGDRSLALKADNSVVSWGLNADNIAPPPAPGTMLGISAGSKHSLGLVRKIQIALTGDLPVLKENQPLSDFGFTASGGSGNYTWSVVGTKPDWLTLNATTGLLSGTPTTAGNQTVTVRVSSGGRWSDIALTFEIQKAIPTALWVATTGNNTTGDGSLGKPFATITKAHAVANRGDVIKVLPGNYTESLVIEKSLEISSTAGPAKTTIRSAGLASAVYCKGEGIKGGKLIGFTLTGGGGANNPGNNRYGGGFAINAPAGTTYEVKNCIISENNNPGITFGGGISATGGTTLSLTNSLIHSNAAWASGGAIFVEGAILIIDRCTIVNNTCNGFNRVGGISAAGNCNIQIKNSILWNNTTNQYGSFSSGPGGNATFTFSYSDIQGGTSATVGGNTKTIVVIGSGCIDADPKFAETTNYTLGTGSPAINTGDLNAAKDTDGTRADMGWDFAATSLGADSDGDGILDTLEQKDGTNPNDPTSFDTLSRSLVAYYPFNGNANDESGNGNDGFVNSASLAEDRFLNPVSAYKFDGAGFIHAKLNVYESSYTCSLWFKTTSQNTGLFSITNTLPPNNVDHDRHLFLSSGNLCARLWNNEVITTSSLNLADGRWHHVVYTYSSNGIPQQIYVDGVLSAQGQKMQSDFSWQDRILMGYSIDALNCYFTGNLDNIRIYNRALTAAEVTQLYSKESGQPNTVLVQGGTLPAGSALAGQAVSPFHIARFETTWAEWKNVRTWAAANGYDIGAVGQGSADNHPVRNVNWYDAIKWLNAKSEMEGLTPVYVTTQTVFAFMADGSCVERKIENLYKTGQTSYESINELQWIGLQIENKPSANGYRLPMEAEWEFAARGGSLSQEYIYAGGNNINEVAVYRDNSTNPSTVISDARGTWPVGTKKPNELGLYDMSGNVWEWCFGDCRFRGGGWADGIADYFSLQRRNWGWPGSLPSSLGFRIARNAIGAMVTVQGGTLPQSSALAGQSVQAFQIGKYEVTWGEWKTVRTWATANGYTDLANVGAGSGDDHPVHSVSWYDAIKWSNAKSEMEGLAPVYTLNGTTYKTGQSVPTQSASANGYRLPFEAEWEWAARGGVSSQGYTYSGSNDINAVAWHWANSNSFISKIVGTKMSNELGIFDMSGNVWEWCFDRLDSSIRRIRSGGWDYDSDSCRVVRQDLGNINSTYSYVGFRLARNIGPKISISGTMLEPTLNQAYAGYTFTASGSTGASVWSVSSGSLPPGMSFNATTATLSGTPTTAGNYTFTIKVASGGYSDEVGVTLQVKPILPPVVTATTINGEFGSALSANITATNSPTSYTISSGSLPTGLSLNATTGRISGTPTAAGDGTVVGITASNAGGNGSANLTFNISKGSQTISGLAASVTKTYGDAVFGLNATSSANLTVTYSSSNTAVATISGGNVSLVAPGNTTITASHAGNANYAAATAVTTLTVNKKVLSLTGVAVASKTYDGSTSATINGTLSGVVGSDVITFTGTGTFADSNVGNGKAVTSECVLGGTNAPRYTLTQPTNLTGNITAASVTVTASVASKIKGETDPVFYYSTNPYSLSGGSSFTGSLSRAVGESAGNFAITQGTLSAGSNYAINFVGANFTIKLPTQTISFPAIDSKTFGDAAFTLNATASSGLPVNYSSSNASVATVTNTGRVTTLAGSGSGNSINGNGVLAGFSSPKGIAVDSLGNIYVAEAQGRLIRKITPNGDVTTLAGSGSNLSIDGIGVESSFASPQGIALDEVGNIYVADADLTSIGSNKIRKITPSGIVTTLAGRVTGSNDGTGSAASFSNPKGVAVDSFGNVYVADSQNCAIRKITSSGVVTTLAGGSLGSVDGSGINAKFYSPSDLAVDSSGNLYVADTGNHKIRKITSSGVVSTLAGSGNVGLVDGYGVSACFNSPVGIAVDSSGNLYVADTGNHRIRKITSSGLVSTLAGSGNAGSVDGMGAEALFKYPNKLTVDNAGNVYVADEGNHKIRKITPAGVVTVLGAGVATITASQSGNANFAAAINATQVFSVKPLISASGINAEAILNQAYSGYTFTASGSNSTKTWSISSGNLPPGMTLNATTGTLSGTPTVSGDYGFTINVTCAGTSNEAELGFSVYESDAVRLALKKYAQMVTVPSGVLPEGSMFVGEGVPIFQIGKYEVTWSEWQRVRTWALANGYTDLANIGAGSGDDHPVQSVNWYDAVKWCNAKSQMESLTPVYRIGASVYKTGQSIPTLDSTASGYRLPAEVEWEWAARGATQSKGYTYSGSSDLNAVGWYFVNAGYSTKSVGTKTANELRLFDMSGNVWEWCWDAAPLSNRVVRGGSYLDGDGSWSKVATSNNGSPLSINNTFGLRLARNIGPKISITGTMPVGTLDQPYVGYSFSAGGTTSTKVWSISDGSLPPGMSLNSSTGMLSGTPTSPGTYNFVVRVTVDGYSDVVDVEFEIPVPSNYRITNGLRWASRWAGGPNLYEIEYGGGWYVARENGTNIWRTQDGVNWSSVQVASGITLSELGYADGVWLAVASNSKVYRSIDNGASWTLAGTMPGAGGSLLKTGGVWLALNGTTVYRSSDNGSTWSSVSTGAAQSLTDMVAGGGVIVAVGYSGEIVTSSNGGVSWTRRTSGYTTSLYSIAYGNGRYVAVGDSGIVLTSFNGVTWQAPSSGTTQSIANVSFGNGMFVRSRGDVSADGVAWTMPQEGSAKVDYDDCAAYGAVGWLSVYYNTINQTVGGSVPYVNYQSGTKLGTVGESFQYQISSSGATSFLALKLPPGLSLNKNTGLITGVPTASGTYDVILYAFNANGHGNYRIAEFAIADSSELLLPGLSWTSHWNGGATGLYEVEFGGGWYVARENDAYVWRTRDGVNWSSVKVAEGITLSELGYADGAWLAVASNSKVYRSTDDGAIWTLAGTMPGVAGSLLKTGGVWLALNETTVYRSSDNGSTWSSVATGAAQSLQDMTAGGGVIVAVGNSGEVVSSSNGGVSWTRRTSGNTQSLRSIAYGNGRFVAVGDSGVVLTSFDGVSWQAQSSGTNQSIANISFGNGMFVRSRGYASADGVAWTMPQAGGAWTYNDDTVAYGAVGWLSVNYDSVYKTVGGSVPNVWGSNSEVQGTVGQSLQYQITSSGGATAYTAMPLPLGLSLNTMTGRISGTPLMAGTYKVYLYGANANGYGSYNTAVFSIKDSSSPDVTGLSWRSRWIGGVYLYEIEYGGGWYIARENGSKIRRTQDGVNWSSVEVASGITLSELGYADGVWLALYYNTVYRSSDNGANWSIAGWLPGSGNSLLKTGEVWLACNGATVYRSSNNGSSWSSVATGAAQSLNDMTTGGGLVVAVGNSGEIVTSSNGGSSWTRQTSGTDKTLYSIAYGNGRFVAVGERGTVLVSADAVTWLAPSSGTTDTIRSVAFGNGVFVRSRGDASFDGASWTLSQGGGGYSDYDDTFTFGAEGWLSVYYDQVNQSVSSNVPDVWSQQQLQGIVGENFQYQIWASEATSYVAFQLPPGLNLNATTGVISGTPTTAGTYQVFIYAANANGYGSYTTSIITISN